MNLNQFIGNRQLDLMVELAEGEEGQHFVNKMLEIYETVTTMPKTYETDGMGDDVTIRLHYFHGGSDWWITERDSIDDEQAQAFGYARLHGDTENAELGYISIIELVKYNVELDLYWEPITLGELKQQLKGC